MRVIWPALLGMVIGTSLACATIVLVNMCSWKREFGKWWIK